MTWEPTQACEAFVHSATCAVLGDPLDYDDARCVSAHTTARTRHHNVRGTQNTASTRGS